MRSLIIVAVLLLSSGAFLNFWVSDATALETTLKGDTTLQWMWAAVDAVVLIVCLMNIREVIGAARRQVPLLLFVVWAMLSLVWSQNPQLTLRRDLGLICTTAFGIYLGIRFELKALLRLLAFTLALAIVGSIVAAVLFPAAGLMSGALLGAWRGIYIHKNTMARIMGLAFVTFSCLTLDSKRNRWVYSGFLLGAFGLIVLSRSITAILVTLITCAVGLWRRRQLRRAESVAFFAVVLLAGVSVSAVLEGNTDALFQFIGRSSTLSGRTYLWQLSFEAVAQRPFLGSGWDVFWGTSEGDRIRALIGWDAPHAHNAFLDLSLNVGIIGLGLFLVGLFGCMRRARRYSANPDHAIREFPLLFYSYIFFYMFTETMLVDRHSLFQIMLFAIPVALNRSQREEPVYQAREMPLAAGLHTREAVLVPARPSFMQTPTASTT
ncbi:MAG: O-antigen ligase family protein [Bryobacteraceae bacterium]